jgi:hypothetical protein
MAPTDDAKRQQDLDRIRRQRERLRAIEEDLDAPASPAPPPDRASGTRRPRRLRGVLVVLVLIVVPILLAQLSATIGAHSGHDFADAKRTGKASVESCDRRGPISLTQLGYWDDCTVAIRWDNGTSFHGKLGRPQLFHASDVGKTVQIGDNGRTKFSHDYSRPDFPPRPGLRTLSTVIAVIDILPVLLLLYFLWTALKMLVRRR